MTRRDERGFTLIETLVALTIMIAVAVMLYRGLSSALGVSGAVERAEAALLVAKARLAAVGIETPLQPGAQEGRDGDVSWRLSVRPYLIADEGSRGPRAPAYWATITVSWRDGRASRPRSLQLTTLKLGRPQ
jgi:general secretion pathway protein I